MANVHVNLLFEANTQNAKNNINQLAQLLNQVSNTKIGVESGSISQAAQAARDLQLHLGNAVNVNTGKLDLTKLNTSLKQSNQSLTTLSTQLVNAGTAGQQAFVKLANSIASAQAPAFKLGATITAMMKTMTSAAMWSVAYGALDSLTQAFTGAIDYAKDLNKALTDIAIVSELSAEQLDNFAIKASKAAKELKTTTTEYAKAALIFYQQGLSGEAVEERANAVIKMSQVTGQTAQTVSDQLTAIWNNFADGSETLEYYVDVITALGAATASSTDEIAQGLEKFAAIAETVGLSYEYAASALATVTSETRQSADVVGTAFKTLFARLEGLQLGETLDDGTTLNKYSQALETVGVSIKNSNGELRDMDYILDDLGSKWQLLSKDQQVALAQTVGGMRQYNQFIALMDNYDTFKVNVDLSLNSEGTLDLQQEKWAQSAEAAAKEVEQAWNDLYSQILDDDTVIEFTRAIADVIGFFGQLIDSAGGLGPILLMVAGIFSNKLIPLVTKFGTDLIGGFKIAFGLAQKETEKTQLQFQQMLKSMVQEGNLSATMQQQLVLSDQMLSKKLEIEKAMVGANEAQKKQLQNEMAILEYYNQEAQQLAHKTKELQEQALLSKQKITFSMDGSAMRKATNDYVQEEHKQLWDLGQQKGTKINSLNAAIKHGDLEKEKKLREEILKIDEKIEATRQRKERAQNSVTGSKTELIVNKTNSQSMLFDKDDAAVQSMLTNKNLGLQNIVNVDEEGKMSAEVSINNLEKMVKARLEYNNIAERSLTLGQELNNLSISSQDSSLIAAYMQEAQALEALNQAKAEAAQYPDDPSKKEALTTAENNYAKAIQKVTSLEANASATSKQSSKTIAQVAKSYEDLAKKANLPEKSIGKVTKAINNLRTNSGSTEENVKTLKKGFIDMASSANLTSDNLQILAKNTIQTLSEFGSDEEIKQFINDLKAGDEASRRYAEALEQAKNAADRLGKQSATAGQIAGKGFMAMTQTMGSLSMAWQSLQSIIDTFNDEDATGLEKTMSLLMGLTMILPTVTSLFSKNSAVMEFASMISNKLALSSGAVATGKTTETAVTAANTPVTAANAAVWYAHPIIWIAAVIIAAIAAIALLSVALDNNTEKVKTNAEKAQEAYESNAESLERMKNAVKENDAELKNLIDTLNKLETITDSFDSLVEGSTEWNNNLQESTKLIQELLKQYPELAESGWIGFDKNSGTYQVLDMDSVKQYVQGKVTVENMALQAGMTNAAYRKEMSSVYAQFQKEFELNEEKLLKLADGSGYVTAYRNEENEDQDYYLIGNYQVGSKENPDDFGKASNTAEAFGNELEKTHNLLASKNNLIEQGYDEEFVNASFNAYKDALGDFKDFNELTQERLEKEQKITEIYKEQYKILSQGLLTNIRGYSDLANVQKEAAARISAELMMKDSNSITVYSGMDLQEGGFDALEALTGKSIKRDGYDDINAAGEATSRIDIGDVFSKYDENKEFIDEIMTPYLESQGYQGNFESWMTDNLGELTSEGVKKKGTDEMLFYYQDAIDYYSGLKSVEPLDDIIEYVQSKGVTASALATGNLQSLSPEEAKEVINIAKDGITDLEKKNEVLQAGLALAKDMGTTEEEYWNNVQQQAQNYNASLYETQQRQADLQRGNIYIDNAAEQYGLDAEVVKNYAKEIQNANEEIEMSYEAAAKLAVSNARLSKGLESLRSNWEKSSEALKQYTKGSYEWVEAATEIASSLSEVFGVDVSVDFVDKYKEEIETLVKGGEEAQKVYEKLEAAAAKDYVISLGLEGKYEKTLTDIIDDLTSQEYSMTIGMNGDISQYTSMLEEMLNQGLITKEQLEATFNSFGWSPKIEEHKGELKPMGESWTMTGQYDNLEGNRIGKETWEKIVTYGRVTTFTVGDAVPYTPKSSPSISSPPKSSSSGGGSKTKKKNKSDEIERYHEAEKTLESLERQLNKVSKAKDRAFGKERIKLAKEEQKILEEEIEAQKRLVQEAKGYLALDRKKLLEYGAIFDEDGNINNYDELYKKEIDAYNAAIDSGNESTIEAAEKRYENFQKAIKNYEDSLNKSETESNNLADKIALRFESALDDIQASLEETLDMLSDKLELLQFQLDNLSDPIYEAAEAIAKIGEKTQISLSKQDANAQAIKDSLKEAGLTDQQVQEALSSGTLPEGFQLTSTDLIEDLRKYKTDILTLAGNYEKDLEEAFTRVNEAAEEANKKMEEQGQQIENNISLLKHYNNITDLVGKKYLKMDSATLNKLNQASVKGSINQLTVNRETLEMNESILTDMLTEYDSIKDSLSEKDKKRWEKLIEDQKKLVEENRQNVAQSFEDALSEAAEAFTSAVEMATTDFKDEMAGIQGAYEILQSKYEQRKQLTDLYVKDYEKIYELSKLTRDIENSIDSTDSIKGKERLREIQEEINALQESGAKMTKYEVDELRAKYNLRLAEIALEEAQNAKSNVRMQRDAGGNWSYVYTADQESINGAKQAYEDQLYSYQQLTDQYLTEMQDRMMALPAEYAEAMLALREKDWASEEEYQAAVNEVREYYSELFQYYIDETNGALANSKEFYEDDWMSYAQHSDYKISANENWIDSWDELIYAQLTGFDSAEAAERAFDDATGRMVDSLIEAYENWSISVDDAFQASNTSMQTFKEDASFAADQIVDKNQEIANSAAEMSESYEIAFQGIVDSASIYFEKYSQIIDQYKKEAESLASSLNTLIQTMSGLEGIDLPELPAADVDEEEEEDNTTPSSSPPSNPPPNPDPPEQAPSSADVQWYVSPRLKSKGDIATSTRINKAWIDYFYASGTGGYWMKLKDAYHLKDTNSGRYFSTVYLELDEYNDLVDYLGFDTGGYTGTWDSSGRLAMLHQKEIVLNAHDTENFLAAIDILRSITKAIDLQAIAQSNALGSMMRATVAQTNAQTIQQEVTIHAEFPNATNHSEIEEAFETLLTRSTQFANRKI